MMRGAYVVAFALGAIVSELLSRLVAPSVRVLWEHYRGRVRPLWWMSYPSRRPWLERIAREETQRAGDVGATAARWLFGDLLEATDAELAKALEPDYRITHVRISAIGRVTAFGSWQDQTAGVAPLYSAPFDAAARVVRRIPERAQVVVLEEGTEPQRRRWEMLLSGRRWLAALREQLGVPE